MPHVQLASAWAELDDGPFRQSVIAFRSALRCAVPATVPAVCIRHGPELRHGIPSEVARGSSAWAAALYGDDYRRLKAVSFGGAEVHVDATAAVSVPDTTDILVGSSRTSSSSSAAPPPLRSIHYPDCNRVAVVLRGQGWDLEANAPMVPHIPVVLALATVHSPAGDAAALAAALVAANDFQVPGRPLDLGPVYALKPYAYTSRLSAAHRVFLYTGQDASDSDSDSDPDSDF